jgi:hypothetical protein
MAIIMQVTAFETKAGVMESKYQMLFRFTKLFMAVGLLVALWGLSQIGRRGPVRILQFYASVGTLTPGDKAQLCYGVENARSIRIVPTLPGVYPAYIHCLEIVPEHTTHYTLQAEGYDGTVATRSFTLPVQGRTPARPLVLQYAGM